MLALSCCGGSGSRRSPALIPVPVAYLTVRARDGIRLRV
jgi:hypothetical protein